MLLPMALVACSTTPPEGLQAVSPFDADRYLGRWYEIVRLDHRFERGLSHVSAQYDRDGDTIRVINRGYNVEDQVWEEAVGKARFAGSPNTGSLEVSFFGPFYGGYHVVALDPDYQWAMVTGDSSDTFWILARQPQLDDELMQQLTRQARAMDIAVEDWIRVKQDNPPAE